LRHVLIEDREILVRRTPRSTSFHEFRYRRFGWYSLAASTTLSIVNTVGEAGRLSATTFAIWSASTTPVSIK
jgi:hypothetical protein